MMWKAGAGSLALAVAIAGFAAGELLIRGPGSELIETLDDASRPSERALTGLLDVDYGWLPVVLGAISVAVLLARPSRSTLWGLALGAVAAATWIAADLADYGYGLGFVGAAEGTRVAIEDGGSLPFQLYLALGVIGGAALIARRRLRVPDAARATRALAGGLLMGVGGNLAHGCNIGHGVTGVPLLSFGSMLAIACMAAGALLTWRLVLAPSPRLRGSER